MENKKTISVIIPCYNEESSIKEVINALPERDDICEIIIVNDGSTDKTAEKAQESGRDVKIISHTYNIGNGAAVKTGARVAKGDYILFMDGDGQHKPGDISNLIKFIDKYDMIIGARSKSAKVSGYRTLGNRFLNWFSSRLTNVKILDLTSGFRLVNRDKFMEFYNLYPNQYSYPTTSTMAFIKSGYFIKFVEMDTIEKRKNGKSGLHPIRDGIKFINIMFRVIILFSPMRFFFPAALLSFFLFLLIAGYQLTIGHKLGGISIILFLFSIQIFFIGLVIDQISYFLRKR